ncbi:hypothetical protein [Constantimarinum furrinae]|uniref:Uncharacterized protein n=1 Tax=Constantimarinum furrinae TaxID=2562285 RepID=A0A7G8PWZ4_9FLAO|nr:hypothetical protein [Constantimarinum furrinae]QNJ98860.1 hypothetical protein ALE3EI_2319 [Constantimarinum furrinae]
MIKYLCFAIAVLFAQSAMSQDEYGVQRPKSKISVSINDTEYTLTDGDTITHNGDRIIVKTSDHLTFDYGLLKFDYPNHFAFEYDEDIGYRNWTLDGNNYVVMYFEFRGDIEFKMLANEIVQRFGRENCEIKKDKFKLGDIELVGEKISVNIIGETLDYGLYEIKSDDNKTHFIAFQDSLNDYNEPTEEGIQTLKLIGETISKR